MLETDRRWTKEQSADYQYRDSHRPAHTMEEGTMTEQTWTFIDKSAWTDGVWQNEPDKVQWVDVATGLPCLAVRQSSGGHWCGYVGVAEGHPFYRVDYSSCPDGHAECYDHAPDAVLDAHGGITYSALCDETSQPHGICHIPAPGQPEHVWWFGWDSAHAGDLSPAWYSLYMGRRDVYRDLEFVREENRKLAAQLAALCGG